MAPCSRLGLDISLLTSSTRSLSTSCPTVRFDPEGGRSARIFRSRHRYVWPAELDLMAHIAGFSPESRHAGWSEEPFTTESSDHVSIYRLRESEPPER